ncbi:prohibitin family protein [Castellaniella hirudinis]|uniref:prohibitin family protein n=1 Tax=Castellaniella hirudinis TaxID=1144617 RepID=UPI0039C1C55F
MNNRGMAFIAAGIVTFLAIVLLAFGSWFQVDQGERGVLLRNGKLSSVAGPGLGFKTPVIDSVRFVSVRDHNVTLPLEAYSYDQQPASMQVSVTYRVPVDRVSDLYSEYGTLENLQARVIERRTPDAVKNVFGKFTAVRAIQEREKLGTEATQAVTQVMRDAPVQIVGVQVEEVGFSSAYEQSIEQRMLAQVQIETTRQQKETATINAEIQVVKARAEADALREAFQAEADGIRLRGDAEAAAIQARADALAANTNLVSLIAVEKWDGSLPTTQVPGSALPFIGIK